MRSTKPPLPPLLIMLAAACSLGADWPQFRGHDGTGVAEPMPLPHDWPSALDWKVDIPGRGPSSPIVVGDRVLVTASSGPKQDRLHVLCFDAAKGKKLWHRQFWATGRCFCHPSSANAAPTPASDGKRIFAFYSSNDLICLDLDGNLQWYRGLAHERPRAGNDIGMASSPLVVGERVIVQIENQGDSFAMAMDTRTGKTHWTVARRPIAGWSSPIRFPGPNGADAVLLQSPWGITAHDPVAGQELWRHEAECSTVCSAAVAGGSVCLPSQGITLLDATQPSADGPKITWSENRLQPSGASPLIYRGRVYAINRAGVLTCAELSGGKIVWRLRLDGHHYATPVAVGSQLLLISNNGKIQVVELGDEGKLAAEYETGVANQATPAVANGGVYIRSDSHLTRFLSPSRE